METCTRGRARVLKENNDYAANTSYRNPPRTH